MKILVVIVGSFLVASWANAQPLPDEEDDPYYDDSYEEEAYRRKRRQADDEDEDSESEAIVRKKRQFKAEVTASDGPGGKSYTASGGYTNDFNNGRTSVDIGGYSSWGAGGSDKGLSATLTHRF